MDQPRPARAARHRLAHDPQGADDQHLLQVAATLLFDAAQPLLAAAGVLLRNKPDPDCEVAAGLERLRVKDRAYQGTS